MGMLYRRGEMFWIKYYVEGKSIRESTGSTKQKEAERFLKDREGRAAVGAPILPRIDRIPFSELAEELRKAYEVSGTRGLKDVDDRLKPLRRFFNNYRLPAITNTAINQYAAMRQASGLANGTINRELSLLGRALRFAYENGKLSRPPRMKLLKEAAPRSGFFEKSDFDRVRKSLAHRPDLQTAVTIAYTYGWRVQSEVLGLQLANVDLEAETLTLDPGTTKNGEGRIVYLTPELKMLVTQQIDRVKTLSRKTARLIKALFPNPHKGKFQGEQLKDFRKTWATASRRTGLTGMLRHDFRRSAVRNLVNSGVPERVAMKITGHRTRAIFDRYHIVSPADLKEASRKLAGTIAGTVHSPSPAPDIVSA